MIAYVYLKNSPLDFVGHACSPRWLFDEEIGI